MTRVITLSVSVVIVLCGCAASHWGGEAAGKNPGVHVRGGSLVSPPEASFTGDGGGRLGKLTYSDGGKDGPLTLTVQDVEFTQAASSVVEREPAKIRAIADLQRVQVEYVQASWAGMVSLAHELAPILKLLAMAQFTDSEAGLTMTLPSGVSVGGQKLSTPAELQRFFSEALQTVEATAAAAPPVVQQ
ncbi:MAG TPA: hypothetical protein PLU99_06165 [Phycisphaerae bacterium]|jgi:hypothetical protein|nr:hypothetical protein [Phycisphaerae bacterium]